MAAGAGRYSQGKKEMDVFHVDAADTFSGGRKWAICNQVCGSKLAPPKWKHLQYGSNTLCCFCSLIPLFTDFLYIVSDGGLDHHQQKYSPEGGSMPSHGSPQAEKKTGVPLARNYSDHDDRSEL